ncbi:TlpA family protein disulfide reductase [Chitinophaga sp. Hz27]|uniref:TlpA family protein disulfide reductase n=1 Tax=Chitinophaga sp. Hz27 TaxID=3347169 RepID=UPI0035DD3E76
MKLHYCLMALLCLLANTVKAKYLIPLAPVYESACDSIKPLAIGDTIPDILFEQVINYKTTSAHLSDFKGRLVILDFWATWCSSCIRKFPISDSLQQAYNNSIQILLINSIVGTGDSMRKVTAFVDKWNSNHVAPLQLPIVVSDVVSRQLFPHTYLPHLVWIGVDQTVKAITSSTELTKENIERMLSNTKATLMYKWN